MTAKSDIGFRYALLWALLFAVCLLFCACGEAADTSGLSGSYVLVSVEEEGMMLPAEEVRALDLHIRLDPGGGGVVIRGSEEGTLTWALDGDRLSVRLGSTGLSGWLEGSGLLLQPLNSTQVLRFSPDDQLPEEVPAVDPEKADLFLEADWYGWWKTEQSDGRMPVSWYDCCASFLINDDGTVSMSVWDEDGSREDPVAGVLFDKTEDGEFVSISGYFLYDSIEAGEWRFQIPENELFLENYSHSGNEETFSYSIYLRPWGAYWSDLSDEQLPFYYEDWYLPLIQDKKPMPDRIPWEELEEARVS